MNKWESERQLADELQRLKAQVKELQDEIRNDALSSNARRGPVFPTDEERRSRDASPGGPERGRSDDEQ